MKNFSLRKKTILIIVALVLIIGYIGSKISDDTQEETSAPVADKKVVPIKPISIETATVEPLDPKLLHPYTEEGLRLEIDNRNESDANTITSLLYRARWSASKDPIKSGNRWTELTRKYNPVIGEKKLWAIMHLADYDQMNERHQIHDSH